MKRIDLSLLAVAVFLAVIPAAQAKPFGYELPEETAEFAPGPNSDVAQGNCTSCHSVEYVTTQPRGARFGREFWQAEVTKMIRVYGAPIDDEDAKKIVDYLAMTYSK